MANSVLTQILEDGHRNAIVKITGILDTSNVANAAIVVPSSFSPLPTQFRVDYLDYSISDGLEVVLQWDATTPVPILPLAGRGRMNFNTFGGLQNDAGAGKTGSIDLYTKGWTTGIAVFSIVLELVKQGVVNG